MPELAIIADDLTGALDATAPFAMRGISSVVALSPAALPDAMATGARVVGVSTDSREMPPHDARESVRAAALALPAGIALFKKVDSRLKGNIDAELTALPHRRSLVVPAIPTFGRWALGGKLGGFGVLEPIDIAARLGSNARFATIPNVATQVDIDRALASVGFDLLVGARGLAEAVACVMAPVAVRPDTSLPKASVYCVIGSTDPITLAQIERLRVGYPGLVYIAAPSGVGPGSRPALTSLTVVQATPGVEPADGKLVAASLGETLMHLDPAPGSLLVLSGGATAQVILEQLGIAVMELSGEVLPGLPLARANGLTIITKSGGFGDPNTLVRLLGQFHSPQEHYS